MRADVAEQLPSTGAFSSRHEHLGSEPLQERFHPLARPLATVETPGALWKGMRVMVLDGTCESVPDTWANRVSFQNSTDDEENHSPSPQVRLLLLLECATHRICDAQRGSICEGEPTLVRDVLARTSWRGMLVMWGYIPVCHLLHVLIDPASIPADERDGGSARCVFALSAPIHALAVLRPAECNDERKRKRLSCDQEQGSPGILPAVVKKTMQETMHLTDSRRESFVSELREWLETASASNNPAGLCAVATLIFERLSRVGMSPTLVEHSADNVVFGVIHGENPAARPLLLLLISGEKTKDSGLAYDDSPFWDKDCAVRLFVRAGTCLSST
jgi:hypothetical protein